MYPIGRVQAEGGTQHFCRERGGSALRKERFLFFVLLLLFFLVLVWFSLVLFVRLVGWL